MPDPIPYPEITDASMTPLRVIRILHKSNPDLLDADECPYSPEVKHQLRLMLEVRGEGLRGEPVEPRKTFLDDDGDRHDIMEYQLALALQDINDIDNDQVHKKMDQKDKLAFLKAKPGLIERLMDLKGRNSDQRAVSDFMKRVYRFVDKELTVDQRTKLIKDLGDFIETGAEA
jgi:hypothetical protein